MRLKSYLSLAAPMVALAMMVSTNVASAQNTQTVQNGTTTVTFASDILTAMNSAGLTLGTVSPSHLHSGGVSFAATSGAVDLDTGAAQVLHSGGLTVTTGTTNITLQSFIVDTTTGTPVITGLVSVNGTLLGRLPIFDLSLTSAITLPITPTSHGQITITGVNLTLDSILAGVLNNTFTGAGLTGGIPIGTGTITVTV